MAGEGVSGASQKMLISPNWACERVLEMGRSPDMSLGLSSECQGALGGRDHSFCKALETQLPPRFPRVAASAPLWGQGLHLT